MTTESTIYCFKETTIVCCGQDFAFGRDFKRLDDHIRRTHLSKNDGEWFNGPVGPTVKPSGASTTNIEFNFREQGLLCGYCGQANNHGEFFKPQSLGNHFKKSCRVILSPTVIRQNRELFRKKNKRFGKKTSPISKEDRMGKEIATVLKKYGYSPSSFRPPQPPTKHSPSPPSQSSSSPPSNPTVSSTPSPSSQSRSEMSSPSSSSKSYKSSKSSKSSLSSIGNGSDSSDSEESSGTDSEESSGTITRNWCENNDCFRKKPCAYCIRYKACKDPNPNCTTLKVDNLLCYCYKEIGDKRTWFYGKVKKGKGKTKVVYSPIDESMVGCNQDCLTFYFVIKKNDPLIDPCHADLMTK